VTLKTINTIIYVLLFPVNVAYTITVGQIIGRVLLYSQKVLRIYCEHLLKQFDKAVSDNNYGIAEKIQKKITKKLKLCVKLIDITEHNMRIPKKVISKISYIIYKSLLKEGK
jgi:hypothetical protein